MTRYFIQETIPARLIMVDLDGLVSEAFEVAPPHEPKASDPRVPGISNPETSERVWKKRGPKAKKLKVGHRTSTCKICGEPGHNKRSCPNTGKSIMKRRGEAAPLTEVSDSGEEYFVITDSNDIERIWDCVDSGIRQAGAIAHSLGLNPLAVKAVLMKPRP